MADGVKAVAQRLVNFRAERTSVAESGSVAVAVSGYMAEGVGAGTPTPSPISARTQTTNKGGGDGGGGGDGQKGSLLDTYATTARQSYAKARGGSKNLGKSRRVCRFYQRYFTGVGVGGRLRVLTLTTSDEAIDKGYDIHRHFRALVMRLRRPHCASCRRWWSCPLHQTYGSCKACPQYRAKPFEYIGVREVKGDREHLHLVFRGEYVEQVQLSAMWQAIHNSPVVDIRAVYKARGGARYLAKYLAKEVLNRYWASYNWVFQGWVGWSRRVKRAVGRYPSKALLQSLARLDKVKRWLAMDFLEYRYRSLWEWTLDRGGWADLLSSN